MSREWEQQEVIVRRGRQRIDQRQNSLEIRLVIARQRAAPVYRHLKCRQCVPIVCDGRLGGVRQHVIH
jgi:hypothetical protein